MYDPCDVPSCREDGYYEGLFGGRLCSNHFEKLEADLKTFEVFPPELFVGDNTTDSEDTSAANEGYTQWLARQR